MGAAVYHTFRVGCRFIGWQTIRPLVLDAGRADRAGGFLLACTHLSNLEPIIISALVKRHVRWMTRIEFFRLWWCAAALRWGGAFPVDRFGCSLPAVRTAARLAAAGECVGIFPEGGVATGPASVLRGAPFKEGVCTIAVEARVPVVPVVMLGTHQLNRVKPWLPFRRGRIYCAFGDDINPPARSGSRRADRKEMASRLADEYVRLYRFLLSRSNLRDDEIP